MLYQKPKQHRSVDSRPRTLIVGVGRTWGNTCFLKATLTVDLLNNQSHHQWRCRTIEPLVVYGGFNSQNQQQVSLDSIISSTG